MGVKGEANNKESKRDLDYRVNIIEKGSERGVMMALGEILDEDEVEDMAKYNMDFKKD